MFEYLKLLKKELIRKISLLIVFFTLLVSVFLLFVMRNLSLQRIIVYFLIYLLINGLFYLCLNRLLKRMVNQREITRENISKSLFNNTRNIINNYSHELRTPLNAIMGFSADLYESELNSERKEALKAISENSKRLFIMAKKLIDFSSIETGQYKIVREYMKNDLLLSNLEDKFLSAIENKGLTLSIANEVPSNYSLFTDYNALFEVLEMIVENAVKFSEKGVVAITSRFENGSLNYVVCDTGPGVPDDKKEQIFELYRQVTSDLDREYEGLGLGLTIAEKLTELLGGSISLIDNHPHGSCFQVSIPTEIRETDGEFQNPYVELLPNNFKDGDRVYLRGKLEKLAEFTIVFNPGRIRILAEELATEHKKYKNLADRIIKAADTYDEAEFLQIIEAMIKGTADEK